MGFSNDLLIPFSLLIAPIRVNCLSRLTVSPSLKPKPVFSDWIDRFGGQMTQPISQLDCHLSVHHCIRQSWVRTIRQLGTVLAIRPSPIAFSRDPTSPLIISHVSLPETLESVIISQVTNPRPRCRLEKPLVSCGDRFDTNQIQFALLQL